MFTGKEEAYYFSALGRISHGTAILSTRRIIIPTPSRRSAHFWHGAWPICLYGSGSIISTRNRKSLSSSERTRIRPGSIEFPSFRDTIRPGWCHPTRPWDLLGNAVQGFWVHSAKLSDDHRAYENKGGSKGSGDPASQPESLSGGHTNSVLVFPHRRVRDWCPRPLQGSVP